MHPPLSPEVIWLGNNKILWVSGDGHFAMLQPERFSHSCFISHDQDNVEDALFDSAMELTLPNFMGL